MAKNRQGIGLYEMLGIGALALTFAGVGTYFVVQRRRQFRLDRVMSRAKRVLTRNLAHAKKSARSRLNHFPMHS